MSTYLSVRPRFSSATGVQGSLLRCDQSQTMDCSSLTLLFSLEIIENQTFLKSTVEYPLNAPKPCIQYLPTKLHHFLKLRPNILINNS